VVGLHAVIAQQTAAERDYATRCDADADPHVCFFR
jgi:hypothetical protein